MATIVKGSLIHPDEHDIYARLPAWGYQHKTVCHRLRKYARGEDRNGFFEFVHNARRRGKALLRALVAALVR